MSFDKSKLMHAVAASCDILGRDKVAIMNAIAEYEPWIPCTEKLPEEGTRVETYCVSDDGEEIIKPNFILSFDGMISWGGFTGKYKPVMWRNYRKSLMPDGRKCE